MRKLLPFVLLLGCRISGSPVPTEDTHRLPRDVLAQAERYAKDCAQAWVIEDVEHNVETALMLLRDRGIELREGNPTGMNTALRDVLWLRPGFYADPPGARAVTLSHELVHYCQRDDLGGAFERMYLQSDYRWAIEVSAYTQTIRTRKAQGGTADTDRMLRDLRDRYWLWDIDPTQLERESLRLWATD